MTSFVLWNKEIIKFSLKSLYSIKKKEALNPDPKTWTCYKLENYDDPWIRTHELDL